jgi:hypothetical protein
MPDLLLAVFAARRKPMPARWSRAARAGGHCEFFRLDNSRFVVTAVVTESLRLYFSSDIQ